MKSLYSKVQKLLALAIVFGVVSLLVTCDKPFEPQLFSGYPVYFSQPEQPSKIFRFHPTTTKIDSIDIPWQAYEGICLSADGKLLYLGLPSSIVVLDTDSFSLVTQLPYDPFLSSSVSPDNKLLAITGNDLYILRTSDYSIVFSDTDNTENGYFSADSRSFYCASGWSANSTGLVYKVDLSDTLFPVTRKVIADGGVVHVIPSLDESKLFLYLTVGTFVSAFEVYEVSLDSIIFRDFLSPGAGTLTVTLDGQFAFYTNPGAGIIQPAEPSFTVFDIGSNKVDTVVADRDFFSDSTWFAPPNYLAVTPDSRWLVILGGELAISVLYLYDIRSEKLVFREPWGGNDHAFTNLSVQNSK